VGSVDVAVITELNVDNAQVDVGGRHARFSVYCVKLDALNVVTMSTIFVCTTQTYTEKSTAKHVEDSKHIFRHLDNDVYGYNTPFDDAMPSCLLHISHAAKHAQITHNRSTTTIGRITFFMADSRGIQIS